MVTFSEWFSRQQSTDEQAVEGSAIIVNFELHDTYPWLQILTCISPPFLHFSLMRSETESSMKVKMNEEENYLLPN